MLRGKVVYLNAQPVRHLLAAGLSWAGGFSIYEGLREQRAG